MDIQLRRVAFGVGKSDFVAFLHQGPNRNRQFVEIVASAGINLAIFQWQAVTARDQYQDFSFCCHFVLLSEIESVSRNLSLYRPTQFARALASAAIVISSTRTASYSPKMKVNVMGSMPTASPKRLGRSPTSCSGRALAVLKRRALSDLDDVTVRIADVAANLAVLGYRRCEELGSSAFPQFVARLDIRNAEIHKAVDVIRVGNAERYRGLVRSRPAPHIQNHPDIR